MSAEELASFTFEGQRARPRKKIEYAPIRNTTYLKPPGSCNTKWKTAGKAVGVNVECVEDSKIYILDACEQVSVAECTRCRVVVAPTSGSVFLIDMVDCVISVAAKQIRLRNCQRCELRVFVPSREGLIIEVCSDLTIGAWELSYPELSAQFALSKIDDKATNHWVSSRRLSPLGLSPLAPLTSPFALDPAERSLQLLTRGRLRAALHSAQDATAEQAPRAQARGSLRRQRDGAGRR